MCIQYWICRFYIYIYVTAYNRQQLFYKMFRKDGEVYIVCAANTGLTKYVTTLLG